MTDFDQRSGNSSLELMNLSKMGQNVKYGKFDYLSLENRIKIEEM